MEVLLTGFISLVLINLSRGAVIPATQSHSNHSIIDAILNDTEICETPQGILHSSHLEKCSKLSYPESEILQLNLNNVDTFFCLAIYDRSYKICHTLSQYSLLGMPETLLTNGNLFDAEMSRKKEDNAVKVSSRICNSLKKRSRFHDYKKTENYVHQLINYLDCEVSCYDSREVSPLCLAIYLIDEHLTEVYKSWLSHDQKERDTDENIEDDEMHNNLTLESTISSITEALSTEQPATGDKNLNDKPEIKNEAQKSVDTKVLLSPSSLLIIIITMVIMVVVSAVGFYFLRSRKTRSFDYRRADDRDPWLALSTQ